MKLPFAVSLRDWDSARAQAWRVRYEVFVIEQGVPAEAELDAHDPSSEHALAISASGEAIATGRLLADGHIGRMAVLQAWRGRGAGSAVLSALLVRARERGFDAVHLSAQTQAQSFYQRFGFTPHGAIYLDVGIPHIDMSLVLKPST